MTEEKPVHEQVQDLLASWNKPSTDDGISRLVGDAQRDSVNDHNRNPALDSLDAERMFADDGDDLDDDEDDEQSYDDMTKKELQAEIDNRNADRDEDEHLSKSGKKDDLIARLQEDDAEESDEDDEE